MEQSDESLLLRFAQQGDESAFRTFVQRYLGLVHQVALRRTGNRQLAEEASQNVFYAAAHKAASIAKHPERIPAWLHRTALNQASKVMRSEHSYQRRKKLRHPDEMTETGGASDAAWLKALPHLDQALDKLSASDRTVVLQHYFEGKTFQEIALKQKKPAGTLQKQCRRALEKLSRLLQSRGATLSAIALGTALSPQLAKASSTSLVGSITKNAVAILTAQTTSPLSFLTFSKSKIAVSLLLLAAAIPLGFQQATIARTAAGNQQLRAELAQAPTKTSRSFRGDSRTQHLTERASDRVTIDTLVAAHQRAERTLDLGYLDFADLINSLSEEQLVALIPQALNLAHHQRSQRLCQALVHALSQLSPEKAVRTATAHNPRRPLLQGHGVEHALYLWVQTDETTALTWIETMLTQLESEEERNNNGFQWHAFASYQEAALEALIEKQSPSTRKFLTLKTEVQVCEPDHLILSALTRSEPEWGRSTASLPTATERANRIAAFLPWIREFADPASKSDSYRPKDFLKKLFQQELRTQNDQGRELSERILARDVLTPAEQDQLLKLYTEDFLGNFFNGAKTAPWEELNREVQDWLQTHAPEKSDSLLAEAQQEIIAGVRKQVVYRLGRLEKEDAAHDNLLLNELKRPGYQFLPELQDRALKQAQRISDPQKQAEVITHLSQCHNEGGNSE